MDKLSEKLNVPRTVAFVVVHVVVVLAVFVQIAWSVNASWNTEATWIARAAMWISLIACLAFWRLFIRPLEAPPMKFEKLVVGNGVYRTMDVCRSCGRLPPATTPVYYGEMGDVLYAKEPDGVRSSEELAQALRDEIAWNRRDAIEKNAQAEVEKALGRPPSPGDKLYKV